MTKKQFNQLEEGFYWAKLIMVGGRDATTIIQIITINRKNLLFRLGYTYKESTRPCNNWTQIASVKKIRRLNDV